jgi:metal-sulfur cluster biosynthetic enzyme
VIDEKQRAYEVLDVLATVMDPELGIDIVSLGLVYRVGVDGDDVDVLFTLTVPGCPLHETIANDIRRSLERIPWAGELRINQTFDPPWTVDRLSESARRTLGR